MGVCYWAEPQQRLNFLPLPQGQGSLGRAWVMAERASWAATHRMTLAGGRWAASSAAMKRMAGST